MYVDVLIAVVLRTLSLVMLQKLISTIVVVISSGTEGSSVE